MQDKKMDSQKYIELINALPECCRSYLMTGLSENTLTTKIAYARDIKYFLEFAVNYYPYFSEKDIKDITMDDLEKITAEELCETANEIFDLNRFSTLIFDPEEE